MLVTLALARILLEAGSPAPELTDDAVLLMRRANVTVSGCPLGDAGVPDASGDAGGDASGDAMAPDAMPDGGVPDGGLDAGTPDAGCTPTTFAEAITLVVQPRFVRAAGGSRFAILFVTPSRPVVETQSPVLFDELAQVSAPKIEVHRVEVPDPALGSRCGAGCGAQQESSGCEAGPSWDPPSFDGGGYGDGGVAIESVGPYQVVRVEPADTAELASWLTGLGYVVQQADLDATAPYLARGYSVVAVRVNVDKATSEGLTPLALTWAGTELRLPAAFGARATPATVYIAADHRYELPNARVPFAWKTSYGDAGFLTRNEVTLDSTSPDTDPVAQQQATDAIAQEVIVQTETVRVPVSDCDDELGCCDSGRHRVRPDMIVVLLAVVVAIGRRRRPRVAAPPTRE